MTQLRANRRAGRGVTAIELATVVFLLSLIVAVALPTALSSRRSGERQTVRATLKAVEAVLHADHRSNGGTLTGPSSEALVAALRSPASPEGLGTGSEQAGFETGLTVVPGGESTGPTMVSVLRLGDREAVAATSVADTDGAECWAVRFVAGSPAAWAYDADHTFSECDPANFDPGTITGREHDPSELD